MNKIFLSLSVLSALSFNAFADDVADLKAEIKALNDKVSKLEKKQKRTQKTLSKVRQHDAYDNIKFGLDFRNAVDVLDYKNNETGETAKNNSLLSSRLYLTMKSSPMSGLTFTGKLAVYSLWGSHLYVDDAPLKSWAGSSKASDTVMRVKEAYFVYTTEIGDQPISMSIGRRPSTNGFLANYRENEKDAGSPLAHITNMEVDAAMVKLDWSRFLLEGSYTKFIYGRAHAGAIDNVYGTDGAFTTPYADVDTNDDDPVDFAILLGDAYNNGQHQVMYEWAHIFNTKGKRVTAPLPVVNKSLAAGTADLYALSYKMEGVGDEINDFLDDTILFASIAGTYYNAKDGYSLLGSENGGSKSGYSYWVGALIPDMITEDGKFGFEYNHGSQYWTPMTWAEDTATGSKIAVRGDAYEAYWNFNLFGIKYLPGQIRYTYVQHDYTPNNHCMGWVAPEKVDITSQDIRAFVSYRY
jgi:hypothetical protein